jgi:glycosyltransferase involved in cell wall biosynthesis
MTESPLKILQICFRMPYPLKDGGAIAMYQIAKGLYDNGCIITMLVPITSKHDIEKKDLPPDMLAMADIHTVRINTGITLWGAIKNLFTKQSYYISRYFDPVFNNKLAELLRSNKFDIVQIESLKMVSYVQTIRDCSTAKVVMRSHNVENMIWKRMAETTGSILKKWYLDILVRRTRRQEINTLNQFDSLLPITEVDGRYFLEAGCNKPIFPTPTGFNLENLVPFGKEPEPYSIFHIGALDWMPNREALRWFMENSWPNIQHNYPEVKFYIAGRNMPDDIRKYSSDRVIVVGEVESSIEFMNSKQIMIVPLLSGSGMRIKIIEGMALGKIIISTTVGAEGIGCTNLVNIMIADTALEFAEIVGDLIGNKSFADKISQNARSFVLNNYNNHQICEKLISNYRQILK